MPITVESRPLTKTKAGNVATPRSIEVTMRFDLTGSGQLSGPRLLDILNAIVDESKKAVTSRGLSISGVEGQWAWVYGPWFKGAIS